MDLPILAPFVFLEVRFLFPDPYLLLEVYLFFILIIIKPLFKITQNPYSVLVSLDYPLSSSSRRA